MATGVYVIEHVPSGNRYVGSSIDIEDRWRDHRRELRTGRHVASRMQRTWTKYGKETFRFSILEICAPELRLEREQHYLNEWNPVFNTARIAGATTGYKHSLESRAKMSRAKTGKKKGPLPPETRAKMSRAQKGRPRSPEMTARQAESLRGFKHSVETRAKMSTAQRGRRKSPEEREKIRLAKLEYWANQTDRTVSAEIRAKISASAKGKIKSPEHLAAISAAKARKKAATQI